MTKFLLTVCVFGLLLSSASAQDKTLEQLREERSHIFGIEGLENLGLEQDAIDVRYGPNSGAKADIARLPSWANSRHMRRSKRYGPPPPPMASRLEGAR